MVDRNNLNRIKGILSAKQGAEVPKFTQGGTTYKVNAGDTLSQIVANYNSTNKTNLKWQDVATWNNIADPNKIKVGQTISFVNPTQQTTITGANPDEGNPNAAVEGAAAANQQVTTLVGQADAEAAAAAQAAAEGAANGNTGGTGDGTSSETGAVGSDSGSTSSVVTDTSAGMVLTPEEAKKLKQAKALNAVGAVGSAAFNAVGQAVAGKQMATDSNLTKGVDAGYDAIAGVVENMGPYGKIVGTAMKTAKVAGDLIQEMGGGTDQQTTTDKWMDSAFFSWNIGMLNGFAGKNTDSFGADMDTLAAVGSSYGGTASDINDAAAKAGKKYGLFSTKARKKANEAIAKAQSQQNLMGSIADNATDQRLAVQSMGEQAGLAYSMMTGGGYDQKYTYAAKQGGILEWEPNITLEWEPQVELNWELPKFKEGGNIDIVEELEWIPEFKSGNKIRTIEELIEYAKKKNPRFIQRLSEEPKGIKFTDDEGKDAEGSHYLESRGEYVIPRIQEIDGELKFLSPQEAIERAMESGNYLEMSPEEAIIFAEQYKQGWPEFFKKFKKGGSVGDSDIPETEETAQKNVIPEGALHKNKHHMEHAEGLTKKGIPVIDDDGEQQAEIEHSEIIFTLEVTKKLEEYYEIFYSDESSNKDKEQAALEAGRLLVYQILENTEDRTGLIDSCKKGGSLTLKKSTDDLIEETLEWMPTLIVVEEVIEDTPKEEKKDDKKKSEKEQMKEAIREVLIELLTK